MGGDERATLIKVRKEKSWIKKETWLKKTLLHPVNGAFGTSGRKKTMKAHRGGIGAVADKGTNKVTAQPGGSEALRGGRPNFLVLPSCKPRKTGRVCGKE